MTTPAACGLSISGCVVLVMFNMIFASTMTWRSQSDRRCVPELTKLSQNFDGLKNGWFLADIKIPGWGAAKNLASKPNRAYSLSPI
jgi:hypothetical protein